MFSIPESYYRNDQYSEAREVFTDLYNTSALYGMPESALISYNIAYCHYKKAEYAAAEKWFAEYLAGSAVRYRKDALERKEEKKEWLIILY